MGFIFIHELNALNKRVDCENNEMWQILKPPLLKHTLLFAFSSIPMHNNNSGLVREGREYLVLVQLRQYKQCACARKVKLQTTKMAKSAINIKDITTTEKETNPENDEREQNLDKTSTISRKESLRKVQQKYK